VLVPGMRFKSSVMFGGEARNLP